ncbi:hypothetical protein BHE74_00016492, partial [Ensete ventricosum]
WASSLWSLKGNLSDASACLGKKGKEEQVRDESKLEQQQKKKWSSPRFAVELDGLHCFETIVP